MSDACTDNRCSVSRCDIFDFMAKHVGLTVIHPGGLKATRTLIDSLGLTKESRVIDIACGKGSSAIYLAENHGCNVIGIDISPNLVEEAQEAARRKNLGARVTFQVGNAMELPFPDNSFDAALSQAMLVLVEDKIKAIKEAHRVVKEGGRAGWLELSWKEEIDADFLDKVSNVLCAYCMTNVSTYDGWKRIFRDAGITALLIKKGDNVRGTFLDRLRDEGLLNMTKILLNTMSNKEIRTRSKLMHKFFQEYDRYFGLGIYVFTKQSGAPLA
jgi:arsenite methyltransferase